MFTSSTFLLCDIICPVANQTRTFIFFPSIAIHLRWVLSWAGCGSWDWDRTCLGTAGLELQSLRTVTTPHQLRYLTDVIDRARVPETQVHSSRAGEARPSQCPWQLPPCWRDRLQWTGRHWRTAWETSVLLKARLKSEPSHIWASGLLPAEETRKGETYLYVQISLSPCYHLN